MYKVWVKGMTDPVIIHSESIMLKLSKNVSIYYITDGYHSREWLNTDCIYKALEAYRKPCDYKD